MILNHFHESVRLIVNKYPPAVTEERSGIGDGYFRINGVADTEGCLDANGAPCIHRFLCSDILALFVC